MPRDTVKGRKVGGSSYKAKRANAAIARARATLGARGIPMRTGGWVNPIGSLRPELKYLDTFANSTTIVVGQTTAVVVGPLNKCMQGTDATTRIGRKIVMKSIYILWNGSQWTAGVGSSPLRMIVVYDKQTNITAPAATDVLVADAIGQPNNLANRDRFVTIFDKWIPVLGVGGPAGFAKKWYKKINLETIFNGTNGGTVADIVTGSVYAFFYQNGGIVTSTPQSSFYCRIRFADG